MQIMGLVKRIAPFFLTFALGLFVASFFVSIALPNIRVNRGWRKHKEYDRKIEFENQQLREENSRLKREAMERKAQQDLNIVEDINDLVPPPPPLPARIAPSRR
jgi:hypothetical protein